MGKKIKENTIIKQFDGIIIIPIMKDEPVLIFKNLGKPFFEDYVEGDWDNGVSDAGILSDYLVSWKGKLLGHKLPSEINRQYGDLFNELTGKQISYNIVDLSKEVVELPLKVIMGDKNIKILSPRYIKPARNALRRLGLLQEKRGKFKKINTETITRNKQILLIYKEWIKKHGKKKPFPINHIHKNLDYNISFITIRRVLKKAGY